MNTDIRRQWIDKYNKEHGNEYSSYIAYGKYWAVRRPEHHLATSDGYVYIHQLQAEKKLGRPLQQGECVHHINENKYDNDINNLMVFHSVSDHTAFHHGDDIYEMNNIWFAKKKLIKDKNNKSNKKICPICKQNLMDCKAKQCRQCHLKKISKNIPNKDDLEKLILKYPMTKIGQMYNVSDRAVRKWCKKYNLPFRQKDITDYKNKRVA